MIEILSCAGNGRWFILRLRRIRSLLFLLSTQMRIMSSKTSLRRLAMRRYWIMSVVLVGFVTVVGLNSMTRAQSKAGSDGSTVSKSCLCGASCSCNPCLCASASTDQGRDTCHCGTACKCDVCKCQSACPCGQTCACKLCACAQGGAKPAASDSQSVERHACPVGGGRS